jgi:hypothetical protein
MIDDLASPELAEKEKLDKDDRSRRYGLATDKRRWHKSVRGMVMATKRDPLAEESSRSQRALPS